MGHRDDKYRLDGFIEMEEGFFEGHRKKDKDIPDGKPAKELDRQVKAIVAVVRAAFSSSRSNKASSHHQGRLFKNEFSKQFEQ